MKTCVVYRTKVRDLKDEADKKNYLPGDQVQFEVCVFSDGRTAQRWMLPGGSCVWWDSWEALRKVHIDPNPEYGTRIEWSDGTVEEL